MAVADSGLEVPFWQVEAYQACGMMRTDQELQVAAYYADEADQVGMLRVQGVTDSGYAEDAAVEALDEMFGYKHRALGVLAVVKECDEHDAGARRELVWAKGFGDLGQPIASLQAKPPLEIDSRGIGAANFIGSDDVLRPVVFSPHVPGTAVFGVANRVHSAPWMGHLFFAGNSNSTLERRAANRTFFRSQG